MSVNVKTSTGLKQIADITTKNKVLKVLGYTPANEEDLINHRGDIDIHISSFEREKWNNKPETYEQLREKPSISEDDTKVLSIVDENNNIIAFVDNEGIHTTALEVVTTSGKRDIVEFIKEKLLELSADINEEISNVRNEIITDYNKLENIPVLNESVDNTLYISDFKGNIIAKFDENGLDTTAVISKEFFENGVSLINKYSTKEELKKELAELIDSSPTTLDTLNELAAALGDDPNFATTITNVIGTKLGRNEQAVDSAKLGGVEADKYVLDTKLEQTKKEINEEISNVRNEIITDYNELENKPIENESIENTLYITDKNGNIVAFIDNNGIDAINLYINHKETALKEDVEELKEYVEKFTTEDEVSNLIESNVPGFAYDSDLEQVTERQTKTENDLSDLSKNVDNVSSKANDAYNLAKKADSEHFSGDYNDLHNKLPIEELDSMEFKIVDGKSNIIMKVNNEGIHATDIYAKDVKISSLTQTKSINDIYIKKSAALSALEIDALLKID